jgi:sulfite reductase alpha subunit-like flavoprotein
MSEDVEKTLLELVEKSGRADNAEDWLNDLRSSGRYLKDVY